MSCESNLKTGLVVRPGSISRWGGSPPFLLYIRSREKFMVNELSIFIDESGDFGVCDSRPPWYIITMVFHNQKSSINEPLQYLEREMALLGFHNHCIHTGPIIRREKEYRNIDYQTRRKIFGKMITFIRQSKIKYKSFSIEKKHVQDMVEISYMLTKILSVFIQEHYEFFILYDNIKVYYDNGQIELTKILFSVFRTYLSNVEFRKVKPSDYRLFQVADMICTLELLKLKIRNNKFSKSESVFFGTLSNLKRNYLKIVNRQDIDYHD